MRPRDYGDYLAAQAGEEAPRCILCDQFIEDLTEPHFTASVKPICLGCHNEAFDSTAHEEAAGKANAAATVLVETITEARVIRTRRVNIHE